MENDLIDIEWLGLVESYLDSGRIDALVAKIRQDGVPKRYGNQIADLLIGKVKPSKPPVLATKITNDMLKNQVSYNKSVEQLNRQYRAEIAAGLICPLRPLTDSAAKRIIADKVYQGNYESARRVFNRAKKKTESN